MLVFGAVKYVTGSPLTTAELRNLSMDCLSVDVASNVTSAVVAMQSLNCNDVSGYDDYRHQYAVVCYKPSHRIPAG